jgi:hypothetical protein
MNGQEALMNKPIAGVGLRRDGFIFTKALTQPVIFAFLHRTESAAYQLRTCFNPK